VEKAPHIIFEEISGQKVEEIKKRLEAVGALVEVSPSF